MDAQALQNPNKYEFDARFNRIAEDVLTFNGKLKTNDNGQQSSRNKNQLKRNNVPSNTISYQDYLTQSCPDYQGYQVSGLYNNNLNSLSQQQQSQPSFQIRNQVNNNPQYGQSYINNNSSISPPSQQIYQENQPYNQMSTNNYNIPQNKQQQNPQHNFKTNSSNDDLERNIRTIHEKQKKLLMSKQNQNSVRNRYNQDILNIDEDFDPIQNQEYLPEEDNLDYEDDQQIQQLPQNNRRMRNVSMPSMNQMPPQQYPPPPYPYYQYNPYQYPQYYPMPPQQQQIQQPEVNEEQKAVQKALENQSQIMQKLIEQIQQKKEKEDKLQEKQLKYMTKQLEMKSLEKMIEIKQKRMLDLYRNDMQNYVQMQFTQYLPIMQMQQRAGMPPPTQVLNNLQGNYSPLTNLNNQQQMGPFNGLNGPPMMFPPNGQQNLPPPPLPNQLPMNMNQVQSIMNGPQHQTKQNQKVNELLADANMIF